MELSIDTRVLLSVRLSYTSINSERDVIRELENLMGRGKYYE